MYLWEDPRNSKNREIGTYNQECSIDRFKFFRGQRFSKGENEGKFIFEFEMSKSEINQYDSLLNNSGSPLVNQKIREILICLAPDDVQFFPAKVTCSDGDVEGYFMVNIVPRLRGVDHVSSVYSSLDLPDGAKMMSSIKRLVLKEEFMGGHHVVREGETLHIVVSQKIYDAFQAAKIKGVRLVTPDEYYDGLNALYRRG
jgi:hypothetical protein